MSDVARQAILKPLIDETELHRGIGELVTRIAADFKGDELYVIGLLRGRFRELPHLSVVVSEEACG